MLVPIIFIVAFLTALTGALLESSFLGAKISRQNAIAQYSEVAIADGVADFTHGLAAFVALHGPAGPWPRQPSSSTLKSSCDRSAAAEQCPFRYVISARITAASGAGGAGAGDAALNLQEAVINEQRVSASVAVTIVAPNGSDIGSRTRLLTYRVFDTAPYAVISGSRDVTTVNGTRSAAAGDTGGATTGQDPEAATPATGFNDTRIHVRLTCRTVTPNIVPFSNDQQVAGNDGLPWGNAAQAAYETRCASPDAPTDAFRNEQWINGDNSASGWTQ